MQQKNQAIIFIILASFLGGVIGVFSKIALRQIFPLELIFFRFLFALLVLLPVFLIKKEKFSKNKLLRLFLVSLLGVANVILFSSGLKYTTATSSQLLYAAVPALAAWLSFIFYRERVNWKKIAGITLGLLGSAVIILLPEFKHNSSVYLGSLKGNLIVTAGVLCFSFYIVLIKKLQNNHSPLSVTLAFVITTLIMEIILLPFDLKSHTIILNALNAATIWSLIYVGTLGTAIYYLVYQYALKVSTPLLSSMIIYLQPVFAIIFAGLILGESLTLGLIFGSIIILASVALVVSD